MARKKRLEEVKPVAETPKEPVFYQDKFQEKANRGIEDVSRRFEGKGKTLLYALAALVVLGLVGTIIYSFTRRSGSAARTALGAAIETAAAPVTTQPLPPGYTGKSFKTERERAEAAAAQFQAVADQYGGDVREKARYFAAVNRMTFDRPAAIAELQNLSKNGGEVGSLSKFALAQALHGDGKLDEAAALYRELAGAQDSVVAKDTVNFELAGIYDKQGKKSEAADIYFQIADAASKAKDAEGKAIPPSPTAREAKDKLAAIDPARAAQIQNAEPALPAGL